MADGIDEVLAWSGRGRDLQAAMASFRPDATLLISRSSRPAWAAYRLRLPQRVGTGRRAYSWMFDRTVRERRRAGIRHEVEYALSFAHRVGGVPGPAEFRLSVPRDVDESCARWLEMQSIAEPFVVLHPGSGGSCPAWSVAHHVQLAALLEGRGVRVVFTVGPGDEDVGVALDLEPRSIRRLPRYSGSVAAVAALLSRAAVVVGSSTGPVHLAAAVGARTLALHAPWSTCSVGRWGPYSDRGWALVADLPGAERWGRSRRRRLGARLLDGLSPSTVHACVLRMLDGRDPEITEREDRPDQPFQARNRS